MKSRIEIITEANRIRDECGQIMTDADHWNRRVRKADEEVIDPDPDGELRKAIARINAMLGNEKEGRKTGPCK